MAVVLPTCRAPVIKRALWPREASQRRSESVTLRVSMSFLQPTYCGMNVRPIIKCNAIPNLMSLIVTFFLFLHKIAQRFS
jgi:hypothetical protein